MVTREWKPEDKVEVDFPYELRIVESNPNIIENEGRIAIQVGPLVYCVEGKDLPNGNCLGEWEREQILVETFVSGGPKTACYTVKDGDKTKDICKIKGFVLNAENSKYLNLKNLELLVLGENKNNRITLIIPCKITREKDGSLVSKYEIRNGK